MECCLVKADFDHFVNFGCCFNHCSGCYLGQGFICYVPSSLKLCNFLSYLELLLLCSIFSFYLVSIYTLYFYLDPKEV